MSTPRPANAAVLTPLPASAAAAPASVATANPMPDRALAEEPKPVVGVDDALQRLADSREEMRRSLMPAPARAASTPVPAAHKARGVGAFATHVSDTVRRLPGANVLSDALRIWWVKHPVNIVGRVGMEATRRYVTPIAERSPGKLILGAVAVGAVLSLLRPWRWVLRPALLAGLVPVIAVRVLKEVPAASLMRMYTATVGAKKSKPSPVVGPNIHTATGVQARPAQQSGAATPNAAVRHTATLP